MVEALLKAGCDREAHTASDHSTALHLAAQLGHIDIVGILIDYGCIKEARTEKGSLHSSWHL